LVKEKRRKEAFDLGKVLTGRGAGQSLVSMAPDQVIYAQGDPADAMFYVQSAGSRSAP
jgi:hypothetical protein